MKYRIFVLLFKKTLISTFICILNILQYYKLSSINSSISINYLVSVIYIGQFCCKLSNYYQFIYFCLCCQWIWLEARMLQDFLEAQLWRRNIIPYPKPGICLTRAKMSWGQALGETSILDPEYLTLPHTDLLRLSRLYHSDHSTSHILSSSWAHCLTSFLMTSIA